MGAKNTKAQGDGADGGAAPSSVNDVVVNVYEPIQSSIVGGVYHSGLVIYDTEYTYAGGASSLTGITSHRPRQVGDSQWQFKQAIVIGTTDLSRAEVRTMLTQIKESGEWPANGYSLTGRNCNHFSEFLARKLGLSTPSWINRGAKILNTIGIGNKADKNRQVDLDGNELRESDRAALVFDPIAVDVCVDSLLDLKKIGLLGAKPTSSLATIIPVDDTGARTKLKVDKFIQSDADEQLLLFLPFKQPVRLLSFLLRLSVKDAGANPKTLHLFVNHPNLDFGDADSTPPAQVVTLPSAPADRAFTKEENKEGLWEFVVTLAPPTKFTACSFLTIFVVDNHGSPNTKLSGLTLVGRDK